jgi:hypothetical protein
MAHAGHQRLHRFSGHPGRKPGRWLALMAAMAVLLPLVALVSGSAEAQGQAPSTPTPWPGGVWQPDAPTYGMTVDGQRAHPTNHHGH